MFSKPHDAEKELVNTSVLSKETVEVFKQSCISLLAETRASCIEKSGLNSVNFVELNKTVQAKLSIQDQIRSLIFDNTSVDKFIRDPHTNSHYLNPKVLAGLKEYAVLK